MSTTITSYGVKTIELPNRVKLQYVEQGDSSGVPVILLHGITDSWRSFEPVLPHLSASVRAFAVSQRGHGDSSARRRVITRAISRLMSRRLWTLSISIAR